MSIESSDIQSDQFAIRAQKRQKLIDMGLNPYPTRFPRSMCNGDLVKRFVDLLKGEETTENLTVAGRVYSLRNSGMFIDLHDASGKIQVFCHKKITDSDAYALLPLIDIGDIIGAEGIVRRTERGELTVNASQITILCKSLRPLPEKYHGLTDTETRYRKRYLDIMVNEESRLKLRKRSEIVSQIRNFMQAEEFLEAETPMLHPVYGGATAEPFTTHHNSLEQDMYLRIAPELYLKRIIISGLTDKVFEINRSFRNEGLSTRHNPEFTMLEAYWSYADYSDAMDLVERLFQKVVKSLHGLTTFKYGEKTLDFTAPFKRISMPRAVKEMTGLDLLKMDSDEEARNAATKLGYRVEKDSTWGEILSYLFEQTVEKSLVQPTHVIDFPKDISPFAKEVKGEARLVERFETYCNGWEICNAFSELNDPVEQRRRMTEQHMQALNRGEISRKLDTDFLEAMDYGMPTAAGIGIGIDRLVMLLTGAKSIREVIVFPTMKNI